MARQGKESRGASRAGKARRVSCREGESMPPVIRFAAVAERGLGDALLSPEPLLPAEVDWIVYAPNSDVQDFAPYKRLKGVLNLWAGVKDVVGNPTLTAPLARMVDPGLTEGMVEWVTGHVLRHHLMIDHFLA